jgi:hypothetical protein
MEYVKKFDSATNQLMDKVYKRPQMVAAFVHMLIILYAARLAPELPRPVLNIVNNPYFKLFIFSLILWTAKASPSTSILIALAFMVTMNYANNKPLWEFLDNVDSYDPLETVLAPTKDIAVKKAVETVDSQKAAPVVVDNVIQDSKTVYIAPKVVNTQNGPAVVNPTVVVTPAIVSDKTGKQYVIQPDMTLIQHSFVPEQSSAHAANDLSKLTAGVTEVKQVVQSDIPVDSTACYPPRAVDISKVSGVSKDDYPYSSI